MTIDVIVPYDGSGARRLGLAFVVQYYDEWFKDYGLRIVDGRLAKPVAVNRAVAESGADVIVLNDADSLVPPGQLREAVTQAAEEFGIVFAYDRYRRLSEEATQRLVWLMDILNVRDSGIEWEMALSGSHGCVAMQRRCFLEAGGLDERFGACGYEDLAFNVVCESLWPSRRVAGDLFHVWHPRGWDADPANERRNRELYEREYLSRFGDRDALLDLVAAR